VLYKRSQQEQDDEKVEEEYLLRAVNAYERVLAIDSEDVETHFGLFLCYDRLSRDLDAATKPQRPPTVDAAALQELGRALANPAGRDDAALALLRDMPVFLKLPLSDHRKPPKLTPKLPTIRALIPQARSAFQASTGETRLALAQLLAVMHNESNRAYKADDLARAVVQEYRRKNPAANHAAEAIVIYPTTPEQIQTLLKR
jgi:hypothetical protein